MVLRYTVMHLDRPSPAGISLTHKDFWKKEPFRVDIQS